MSDAARPFGVAFKTLGCKVNQVESEAMAADLLGRGAVLADEADASVIVVNTCTVTGEADAKARKAVRHALALPSRPIVVVTGCFAALEARAVAALGERVLVEADKDLVTGRVGALLGLQGGVAPVRAYGGSGFRTRAMLKIEDGCDAFCSYCIVPYARGVPRGTPLDAVVAEAEHLVRSGVREIVLTGINIGRYRDEVAGADLATLVRAVAATGVKRLRLSSVEPRDLTERFLAEVSETPAFCPHLHVPLQSGSDDVLAAMGRRYTSREYAALVATAREAIPGLAVTTDVIAGFPGETPAQAAETLALCEEMGFRRMHVFRYSPRDNTPAALRADQVSAAEKSARASELRALSAAHWVRDADSLIGTQREVLVERAGTVGDGTRWCEGTTPDYLRVRFAQPGRDAEAAPYAPGDLVGVRLCEVKNERVLGVVTALGEA